jgi:histidinol-phosphate phosphatase family protein
MSEAVILAGGSGSRLKSVTGASPKALVDVAGTPLLGRQLQLIAASGLRRVTILTGYGAQAIADYCRGGSAWGLEVDCVAEPEARGTAGAVLGTLDNMAPRFIVLYGDTVLDVDLDRLMAAHARAAPAATLVVHPNDHPFDSDIVEADDAGRVRAMHPSPHPEDTDLPNLVNAALYVLERDALAAVAGLPAKADFGKHVFPAMLAQGMALHAYRTPEYIKDAGTPNRLARATADIESGRVAGLSLRRKVPAVFIDRDGVLNEERGHLADADDLVLLPGVPEAIARLNHSTHRAIVVTNQPVIARGNCTVDGLARIHARLDGLLGRAGAYVDALYYCPHHPDRGFAGEVPELKIACTCRKPGRGLIDRAAVDLGVDLARSWMIGDTTTDIELARRCALRSILVRTGHAGRDGKYACRPDFTAPDLAAAVDFVLDAWPELERRARAIAGGIEPGETVLIGGAARSGKSSFASALRYALRELGRAAVIVPLDSWLLSEGDRTPGVLGRYDLAGIAGDIGALIDQRTPISLSRYDPLTRACVATGETLVARRDDVVIVEGVPALLSPALRDRAQHRIFVACGDAERRRRFDRDYAWRGLDHRQTAQLYESRNVDEIPLVRRSADFATTTCMLG